MSKSEDLIVWARTESEVRVAVRCGRCGGMGRFVDVSVRYVNCAHCAGQGWFGIDPRMPVRARPGSVEKIAMLTVRYASGAVLWNDRDGCEAEHTVPSAEPDVAAGEIPSARRSGTTESKTAPAPAAAELIPVSLVP